MVGVAPLQSGRCVDTAAGPKGTILSTGRPNPRAVSFGVGRGSGSVVVGGVAPPLTSDAELARGLQEAEQAEAEVVAETMALEIS